MKNFVFAKVARAVFVFGLVGVGLGLVGVSVADDLPAACRSLEKAFLKAEKTQMAFQRKEDAAQRKVDSITDRQAAAQASADARLAAAESVKKNQCNGGNIVGGILTGGAKKVVKLCTEILPRRILKLRALADGVRKKFATKYNTALKALERAVDRKNKAKEVADQAKAKLDACIVTNSPTPTPTPTSTPSVAMG